MKLELEFNEKMSEALEELAQNNWRDVKNEVMWIVQNHLTDLGYLPEIGPRKNWAELEKMNALNSLLGKGPWTSDDDDDCGECDEDQDARERWNDGREDERLDSRLK